MRILPYFFGYLALFSLTSCQHLNYSDAEIRSLMVGKWKSETTFDKTEGDMRTTIKNHGFITYKANGTLITEGDSLVLITLPEGALPIEYKAVVHARWYIANQHLHISRTSETLTPKNEISGRFINHKKMLKLRAKSPTTFTFTLEFPSPDQYIARDSVGFESINIRSNEKKSPPANKGSVNRR